jgi:N-methylhydantoinase B
MSLGIFGGYPGCLVAYYVWRNVGRDEWPDSPETTPGDGPQPCQWGDVNLTESDVFYTRFMGGGGYGDPIDRDPHAVLSDVLDGLVSPDAAYEVYGVCIEKGQLDPSGTAERRSQIRRERLGHPPSRPLGPVPRTPQRLSEYLQIQEGRVQCTACGFELCAASDHWKDHAVSRRLPISSAGPRRGGGEGFYLLAHYCPGCATQLDVDIVFGDDPPLYDWIRWPS